ncbi:Fe-S protein [Caballeronia novacaledonica]|uniref:Fe-S protein n=1 Tax=Caballeronia novacaledonica TaxID=1544861 RepID=A0A2U3ICQ9_9BURK|nr:MOSC N-terminal beta barrel domain-containing protein [Caballeronia novacaledonica]SPB18006.1 Fe-S protein [Caballeronia novacaledonica]
MPHISALFVYPVKSCGAIPLHQVRLEPHGLPWDRHWMVIDCNGRFVSQREFPAMARIRPQLAERGLVLSAPGAHTSLEIPYDASIARERVAVSVWRDSFVAQDEGDAAARWFSAILGAPVRLVRFADDVTRLASKTWTLDADAPTQFADGFPLLVTNQASLDELNARLDAKGAPAIPMDRFRPNIVLSGLDAFEEDFIDTLTIDGIALRMVKPCARCPITTVDQAHGTRDARWPNEPLDTMFGWRANPRVDGGLTFGQNAIVVEGIGNELRVGARASFEFAF